MRIIMETKLAWISIALFLIASSQMSHGAIILNGSFETGDLTGWTTSGKVTVPTGSSSYAVASDGLYWANLNGNNETPNGEISQFFTASIGTTYLLEFDFAKAGVGSGTASLDVQVEGSALLLDMIVNDSTGGLPGAYSHYSYSFIADSTSLVLTFADSTSGGAINYDGVLDDISITAIPEPSTLACIGIFGSGIFAVRRLFPSV